MVIDLLNPRLNSQKSQSSSKWKHMNRIEQLNREIRSCQKCPLGLTRKNTLPGEGSLSAKIFLIGEAPGQTEDLNGRPFMGKSGKVLDLLLKSAGIKRESVYISNIVKCRPPENREPLAEEIRTCLPYLFAELGCLAPDLIITLGKHATEALFAALKLSFHQLSEVHGRLIEVRASYGNATLLPLYHPAAACYNPHLLKTMERDLQKGLAAIKFPKG